MASKFQDQSEAFVPEDSSNQRSVKIALQSKINNIGTITNEVRELRLKINNIGEKLKTVKTGNEELQNTVTRKTLNWVNWK